MGSSVSEHEAIVVVRETGRGGERGTPVLKLCRFSFLLSSHFKGGERMRKGRSLSRRKR